MHMIERLVGRMGLRSILLISILLVACVSLFVFVSVDRQSLSVRGQDALVEEARIFADEMDAVWQFMEIARGGFDDDPDNFYVQTHLHCAIVGKSVGAIFSSNNDYKIRYTNFDPRNWLDRPDEFEAEALSAFAEDGLVREYWGIASYEDEEVFRYVRALEVSEGCLDCHGSPAGEIDVTGHEKEGWTLDSVGGAISIVIPLDTYKAGIERGLRDDTAYILVGTTLACILIYAIVSFFVFRPLDSIKGGFREMEAGSFGPVDDVAFKSRELRELSDSYNEMAHTLELLYNDLEEQVADRTHALILVNEQLEVLNDQLKKEIQYKSNFLSMVSHELRTPLTSILIFTQLLREEAERVHSERECKAWAEIENNCNILLGMINNMLNIARFDAGTLRASMDLMDLGDVVGSVRTTAMPLAKSAEVEFKVQLGPDIPLVYGDYEKTLRMFENLVNNAIKFTPEGGAVLMKVENDTDSGMVDVSVVDDGIGIAEEDRERIFERFVQVDAGVTRRFGGSGLGLTLVREYAELQGFVLEVESSLGKGSTFTVLIPTGEDVIGIDGEGYDEASNAD